MTTIGPPSGEVLCGFVRMAKTVGKCVYVVAEDDQWLPTEDDTFPWKSSSGDYYELMLRRH